MYRHEAIAYQLFDIQSTSGDEAMAFCPEHHNVNTPALSLNMEKGVFVCFSCGFKGSFANGIHADSAENRIAQIEAMLKELREEIEPKIVIDESTLDRYKHEHPYWKNRGLTQGTIEMFDLGYDPIEDAVTIPNRNVDGTLLGVTKRYLTGDARYKHPWRFKKANTLFALDKLRGNTVAIVEGQVDAMKCWQAGVPAVAVYGVQHSANQVELLRKAEVLFVIDARDNYTRDQAAWKAKGALSGFTNDRYHQELDMRRHFNVSRVRWYSSDPKDIGDMSEPNIKNLINGAVPV